MLSVLPSLHSGNIGTITNSILRRLIIFFHELPHKSLPFPESHSFPYFFVGLDVFVLLAKKFSHQNLQKYLFIVKHISTIYVIKLTKFIFRGGRNIFLFLFRLFYINEM